MWPLASAIVLLTLAGDVLIFLSPVIGQQQGLSATVVGAIVSAAAVGGFAVRLASGLFIARLPEWPYIAATLLACAALLLLCTQAASAAALLVLSFLLGAFLGLAQPMTQSLLHLTVPEARVGEALGARLALVGGAQAAGPLLLGLGAQQLGIGTTLALAALVLGVGGLSAARTAAALRPRRAR
jgi:MFS family permease